MKTSRMPAAVCVSDDVVVMGVQAATHWDSLAHASYDGRMYNGHAPGTITAAGAARCGIDKSGPIVGRGVLLDVGRAVGDARGELPDGFAILEEHLRDTVEAQGATSSVRRGDLVLSCFALKQPCARFVGCGLCRYSQFVRYVRHQVGHSGDFFAVVLPCLAPKIRIR